MQVYHAKLAGSRIEFHDTEGTRLNVVSILVDKVADSSAIVWVSCVLGGQEALECLIMHACVVTLLLLDAKRLVYVVFTGENMT